MQSCEKLNKKPFQPISPHIMLVQPLWAKCLVYVCTIFLCVSVFVFRFILHNSPIIKLPEAQVSYTNGS